MLPPGHIAGGYLASRAALYLSGVSLAPHEETLLIGICMASAFAPDLDMLYGFAKSRSLTATKEKGSHRQFATHTPLVWLVASLAVMVAAPSAMWKFGGAMVLIGSWSHLMLDSVQYGIRWLWPLSNRLYAIRDTGVEYDLPQKPFFVFWLHFCAEYWRVFRLTFVLELIVIAAAFLVFNRLGL